MAHPQITSVFLVVSRSPTTSHPPDAIVIANGNSSYQFLKMFPEILCLFINIYAYIYFFQGTCQTKIHAILSFAFF